MLQINEHAPDNVEKIIVANKTDLEDERAVRMLEGKTVADKFNIPFL